MMLNYEFNRASFVSGGADDFKTPNYSQNSLLPATSFIGATIY